MSEEMAVNDNATNEERKVGSDEALVAGVVDAGEVTPESTTEAPLEISDATLKSEEPEIKIEPDTENLEEVEEVKEDIKTEAVETPMEDSSESSLSVDDKRGIKRRASTALSDIDESEEFKGFDHIEESSLASYNKVVERLEAEVTEAVKTLTPLRSIRASSTTSVRASKRARQDTDGSRPSSALSSRSDGEGAISTDASMSPLGGGGARGRRSTTEMSAPQLRVPLERGWRRELVYRAAFDSHTRRNADIYYYTPAGKKLRSTREVAEHLSGTGLTLENFSFFKEPLGIDDPEKEIIRDAKVIRRVESPVPAPPPTTEGKRTPKPKAPKGASPEPATPKSPPSKLKVKSVGSRLSNNNATPTAVTPKQLRKPQPQPSQPAATATATAATAPTTPVAPAATPAAAPAAPPAAAADNNNTTAWKKPRPAPPALQSRPPPAPAAAATPEPPRQPLQPCSMTCRRGVPSLACAACLCLYHPACVGLAHVTRDTFYCKNCRKSSSPPLEPPPLTHKSLPIAPPSAPTAAPLATPPAAPRRLPAPVPVPVPVPAKVARGHKRVLLRMKVAGGGPDGSRLWAVTKGPNSAASSSSSAPPMPATRSSTPPTAPKQHVPTAASTVPTPTPVPVPVPVRAPPAAVPVRAPPTSVATPPAGGARPALPQSLAVLNGRRFIVVPRALVQPTQI